MTSASSRDHNLEDVKVTLDNLKQLNDYGYSLLEQTNDKLQSEALGKDGYLLALFISAVAQVQGIYVLGENRQYRVVVNQVRTLFEICVTAGLLYCHDSEIYAYFLVIHNEREKVKRVRLLHQDGIASDEQLSKFEERLKAYEDTFANMHPKWPDKIPHVISGKGDKPPLERGEFKLKQKCQIIDFYSGNHVLEGMYDRIYPFFSDGAHANLLELSMAFNESATEIKVDIDGSQDFDRMYGFARSVFAWHYELIKLVKEHLIGSGDTAMPSWLQLMAKDIGIDI